MEMGSNVQPSDTVSVGQSMTSSVVNIPNKVKEFWIEKNFNKRQCACYIRSNGNGERDRCACGQHKMQHSQDAIATGKSLHSDVLWQTVKHTNQVATDAFGQIDFQGGSCHATKAQYVRLDHLTSPEKILQLLLHQWTLELPKLLISVHGGIANFDLQPKLKRVFNKGLIKAANTTGAWIITGGTNTGVIRHVGSALAEKSMKKRKKHIVAIGIAPWGVVHRRQDLIGRDRAVDYHAAAHPKNNTAVLNSRHNYFLLADNGTEGKYGADIVLRKELERYISHQRIHIRGEQPMKGSGVPIVCVVLEGGSNTIRTVLDYLTGEPPVPVVVCDGSGRAADLLAFVHKYSNDDGNLPSMLKQQLISTIKKTFSYNEDSAARLYYELIMCMKKKHLITIFRMGEQCQDIDLPILTALLTSHNTSAPQQLSLALSWDRVDVARSHIFTYGQEWPEGSLQQAMLDALVQNKVDFVELLLEKGVNMNKFLTISNMEELYNTKIGSTSTLYMMLRDVRKNRRPNARVSLLEVGEILEKLMGGAYRSRYCRRHFKSKYYQATRDKYSHESNDLLESEECPFPFPFSDLMIWAVLLKRQKMAKFMWRREEEALVKAIVACQLYKSLAREAIDEPLVDNEVSKELTLYAKEFQKLAVDILDHCYKEDDDLANQLLTYELKSFSNQTCISLAHRANMRDFIAHPCCQTLITDMWMGGLRMNKSSTYKVILGILVPFSIIALDFKSKEELQLLPQTEEEHIDELEGGDESSTDSCSEVGFEEIDRNSIIENYAEHADEVNKLITWGPVDDPEPPSETGDIMEKAVGLPDNSFFNNTTLLKLKELRRRHQELKLGKKVSEFYKAPVTKFWLHTMAYLIFMCLYNYIVLVRLERYTPSWMEIYVIVYVFFHGVEMIREIVVSEPTKFLHKVVIFFSQLWNIMDAISLLLFWTAVVLRFQLDETTFLTGRVLYCVNIIFWYIRILELFAVSKNLGPYVVIMGKMVVDMLNFIVILLIILMSFGVARQAIRNPYQEPSWMSVRNVFMEPYFMLYGEVYATNIDPPCGEGMEVEDCWPMRWVTPAIMAAYLLVANILLLNLLIAVFNNTYQRVSQNSREIWMFQRYSLTLEYEIKPLLPAPLIIFSFIYLICKWIRRRCRHSRKIQDYGLKLFMNDEEVRRLHDFEEDCVDDYFNTLEIQFECSTEERIKATNQRVENIMLKMDDINQKENQVKLSMQAMELRMSNIEDIAIENFEQAQRLQYQTSPSNGLPNGVSNSSVEQFVIDSASSGADGSTMVSPPFNRPPMFRSRSRSNSGDDEFNSQRLSKKRMLAEGTRSSLLRRRKGKDLKPIKAAGLNFSQTAGSPEITYDVQPETMLSYPGASGLPSIVENLQNSSSDKLSSITQSSEQLKRPANGAEEDNVAHKKLNAVHSLPVPTNNCLNRDPESLSLDSSFRSSLPSPRLFSNHSTAGSQSALSTDPSTVAFTPIKSSLRNEYTSITDAIDTSCIHISPESSPSSSFSPSNRFYFGPNMDSSDVNRFFPGTASSSAKHYLEQESQVLKRAEEHETKVLGNSIRKRIRQISIDNSNSMSDLAQHLISELDAASPGMAANEQEDSSTVDLAATLPATMLNGHMSSPDDELSHSNHF